MRTTTRWRALAVALSCVGLTLSAGGHSESGQLAEPGPLAGFEAELGSLVPMVSGLMVSVRGEAPVPVARVEAP